MLKIFALIMTSALLLTGCGGSVPAQTTVTGAQGTNEHRLQIVATSFPPYDFARAAAGNAADVVMLLPPAAESHSFEPSPRDIEAVHNADFFIYVGGESDAWVIRILADSAVPAIRLVDCVDTVDEEVVGNMQSEEEETAKDEHVWTSPKNAEKIVNALAAAFEAKDSGNAAVYRDNADRYIAGIEQVHKEFQDIVSKAVRKALVFGDRFPFRYFTELYGLDYDAAFPGCAVEGDASAKTVAGLIDKVKAEKIPVVFKIELSNGKIAQTIAEETGAKVMELHSAHNVSKEDFQKGVTYIDLLKRNEEPLKAALW